MKLHLANLKSMFITYVHFRQYVIDRIVKLFFFYWLIKKVLIYTGWMEPTVAFIDNVSSSFRSQ